MKITKLNTTDTYKLVDKKSWFACNTLNSQMLEEMPELLTGFKLDKATDIDGWYKDNMVISGKEYRFFEIVTKTENKQFNGILWDGTSKLEVGMVVKVNEGAEYLINFINKTGTKLSASNTFNDRLVILNIDECEAATKTEKELTFEKVMSAWKHQSLDFAYDTRDSKATIESVFDVVYEVMRGVANAE